MGEYKEYSGLIMGLGGFVLAQIFNYIQMKFEHKQMMKSINGIGSKVARLDEKQATANERIARIEGYLKNLGSPESRIQ